MGNAGRGEEQARLATLRGLDLVERELDASIVHLLEAARVLLDVDAASLGLVDADSVHIKGTRLPGIPAKIPRAVAFATAVIEAGEPLVVEDAGLDPRFAESLMIAGRFFAGCPVRAANGHCIGALVVASVRPRTISKEHVAALVELARVTEALIVHWVSDAALRPDGAPPAAATALAARAEANAERLLLALGADAPRQTEIRIAGGRASYDPALLRLVLRKHATAILQHLMHHSPARFKDIIAAIPGLNQRTLTTRLEELKAHGLVRRRAYDEVPLRVEYDVPEEARALVEQLIQLTAASAANR